MPTLTPDRLTVPDLDGAHLPGVRALGFRIAAIVETHNNLVEQANRRQRMDDEWSSYVEQCVRLHVQLDATVEAARRVAVAETAMLAHLDRAVDTAVTNRAEGSITRLAEPGHLRCLREGRESVVQALREVRAQVRATR